jgi:hypothetical protein
MGKGPVPVPGAQVLSCGIIVKEACDVYECKNMLTR